MHWAVQRTVSIIQSRPTPFLSSESENDGSEGDERGSSDFERCQVFADEDPRAENDEDHTQFVDRSDAGGWAELQRTEVAEPGKPCADAREHEEEPASTADLCDAV